MTWGIVMVTPDFKDNPDQSSSEKEQGAASLQKEVAEKFRDMYGDIQRVIEENKSTLDDSTNQIGQMEGMIQKMREMQQDIDDKINAMKRAAAAKNIDIDKLLGSTNQLATKGREIVRTMEDELKKKIANAVPREACLMPNTKSKEQMTKERSGKTRGARNKWLPMR